MESYHQRFFRCFYEKNLKDRAFTIFGHFSIKLLRIPKFFIVIEQNFETKTSLCFRILIRTMPEEPVCQPFHSGHFQVLTLPMALIYFSIALLYYDYTYYFIYDPW